MIVVLISAQYYDSTADCDLSLAMMEDLILKESIFSIEKQSFHGGSVTFSLSLSHRVTANRLYRGCIFLQYYWEIL